MNNVIQNLINKSFDSISYDLQSYTDVITKSNLEGFVIKVFLLLVGISMSAGMIYYTFNQKHTNKKSKPTIIRIRRKKFHYIPNSNLTKGEKITHSIYIGLYAAIYIGAIITFVIGVI